MKYMTQNMIDTATWRNTICEYDIKYFVKIVSFILNNLVNKTITMTEVV